MSSQPVIVLLEKTRTQNNEATEKSLCAEDWQRYKRANKTRREEIICSRNLASAAASQLLNQRVQASDISYAASGKPQIKNARSIYISWAHTADTVAAVASTAPVGIDIERVGRLFKDGSLNKLYMKTMHPAETGEISSQDYLKRWTLKEALLKATGLGINWGLHKIALNISQPQPEIMTESLEPYQQNGWQLYLNTVQIDEQNFYLALATKAERRAQLKIEKRE